DFSSSLEARQKFPRRLCVYVAWFGPLPDRFGGVRAHQFGPVFFKEVGAGENVCPDDLSVHGNYYTHGISLSKLTDHALVLLLNGGRDGFEFASDLLVLNHPIVGTRLLHFALSLGGQGTS